MMSVVISNTFLTTNMGMTPQIAITEIHPVGWTDSSHQIFNIQNDVILPNNMSRSHNQWVMKLMPHQDPITNLDFYGNTLPVLWDTGSMYSVISSHTVQKILPNWKEYIKNIDFHTLGPKPADPMLWMLRIRL